MPTFSSDESLISSSKHSARLECRVYGCQASLSWPANNITQQQKEEEEKVLDR
jgi:hypothetical protein